MALFCALAPGGSDLPACTAARTRAPITRKPPPLPPAPVFWGTMAFCCGPTGTAPAFTPMITTGSTLPGTWQVLTARMDPVALDLDGDGTAELVWEIAAWQGAFSFYFRRTDGAICCVTPSEYIDASGLFLAAVEQEGPGPVRLIYRYHGTDEDQEQFCAVTFRDGALEIEMDLVYVPASLEDTVPLSDPTAGGAALPHVSITGPDGWTMDGAGEAAYLDLWSLLWNSPYPSSKGAVIVPTDAPLDAETTYTVTFSDPQAGNSFSWSLDAEGICRLDGIEGNCRMVSTGVGSLPAYCHDVLELYCRASRTARNYDAQGRWLGWDLVPDTVAPG